MMLSLSLKSQLDILMLSGVQLYNTLDRPPFSKYTHASPHTKHLVNSLCLIDCPI